MTAGIPALKTSVRQLVIFAECAATGRPVWELDVNSRAVRELAALAIDIVGQGN